jgi:hypothetical protein
MIEKVQRSNVSDAYYSIRVQFNLKQLALVNLVLKKGFEIQYVKNKDKQTQFVDEFNGKTLKLYPFKMMAGD